MIRGFMAMLVCLATSACAGTVASTVGFPSADSDDDDVLTAAEFNEFFDDTDAYERYDDNDDGMLSRQEYNEAVDEAYESDAYFAGLDTDRSTTLTKAEFLDGWFKMFDGDRNGRLTRGEFENAIDALSVEL